MSSKGNISTEYREGHSISVPCIGLCIVFFLVLGLLPSLPSRVTLVFRPFVIALCVLIPGAYMYRLSRSAVTLIVFHLYLTAVFLLHPITTSTFMAWASMVLFAAFFIVATLRTWTTKEIRFVLQVVFFACFVYSLFLLRENGHLFQGDSNEDITFFGTYVNGNAAAFGIVPGALVGTFFLLFSKPRGNKGGAKFWVWHILATGLMFVMLVGLGGRSAFFSALIGSVLIIWEWGEAIKGNNQRIIFRIFLILLLLVIYHYGPIWTEGTHAYRLFDYDNLMDMNGRDDMAEQAMVLIREHPFFGGGLDYWSVRTNNSLMVHNSFLADGVWGGFTAIVLLGLFFLFAVLELFSTKSLVPIAFFVAAIFHTFTEPGMDYYSYIPLTLAFILHRYTLSHKCMPKRIVQS